MHSHRNPFIFGTNLGSCTQKKNEVMQYQKLCIYILRVANSVRAWYWHCKSHKQTAVTHVHNSHSKCFTRSYESLRYLPRSTRFSHSMLSHSNRYSNTVCVCVCVCATKNKPINYSNPSIHDAILLAHNKCIAHFIRFQLTPFNVHFRFESVRSIEHVCGQFIYIYTFRCVQFAKKKFARCSSKWSICVVFFFLFCSLSVTMIIHVKA